MSKSNLAASIRQRLLNRAKKEGEQSAIRPGLFTSHSRRKVLQQGGPFAFRMQ